MRVKASPSELAVHLPHHYHHHLHHKTRRRGKGRTVGRGQRPTRRRAEEEDEGKGCIEMLELPPRFVNGQYVNRWKKQPDAHIQGGSSPEGAQGEDFDEEEAIFWRYESKDIDSNSLLEGDVNSSSVVQCLLGLKALAADGRLMIAGRLLDKVDAFMVTDEGEGAGGDEARALMAEDGMSAVMALLKKRVPEVEQALKDLESDEDWIFAQTLFGISTYFRRNPDGSIKIKLEGVMENCHAFDMLAVLKEADQYCQWAPCCTASRVVHEFSKTELVLWFHVVIPLILSRDCCMHIYTCDYTTETGSIIFVGGSSEELEGVQLPQKLDGWGADRMEIRDFRAQTKILSSKTCGLKVICTVNPKAHLPQGLLNFCTKRIAGMLIYLLQREAVKMNNDPVNNPLAIRVRNSPLYTHFLLKRVEDFVALMGWEAEPLPAFSVPRDPNAKWIKRRRADGGGSGVGLNGGGAGQRTRGTVGADSALRGHGDGGGGGGAEQQGGGAWLATTMERAIVRARRICRAAADRGLGACLWILGCMSPRSLATHPWVALLAVGLLYFVALCWVDGWREDLFTFIREDQQQVAKGHVGVLFMLQAVVAAALGWGEGEGGGVMLMETAGQACTNMSLTIGDVDVHAHQ